MVLFPYFLYPLDIRIPSARCAFSFSFVLMFWYEAIFVRPAEPSTLVLVPFGEDDLR